MYRKLLCLFAFIVLLVISPARMKAASICDNTPGNIVLNCGFETGDFTDWTVNESTAYPWSVTASDPDSGNFAATTGCMGDPCINGTSSQQSSLNQLLTTNPGDAYSLSFAYTPIGGTPNELDVLWDGTSVDDLVNEAAGASYVTYTLTGLIGTGSDSLTFLGREDPSFDRLDDIIVTDQGPASTPEPGTQILLAGGIAVVLVSRRLAFPC
jgi:hypothetical protein